MLTLVKSWAPRVLLLALAGRGFAASAQDLPSSLNYPALSGWVLADLNGDRALDVATAHSGPHDAHGYAQEVRVTLGALQETSFRFLSPGATVELSSQDVDGDADGDLVVFEPLSSRPLGVWINDGTGSFHEGRLADFQTLWGQRPGPSWRANLHQVPLFAISEQRPQSSTSWSAFTVPEPRVVQHTWQSEQALTDTARPSYRPRGPPRNS